ncbi:MAG TPA: 1,4-alpha-glucan branching enzyme, partial [Beijerinckiaceae bacterium]|nr:1,4-alpha-glucan branching enzyme [Beijerinckiaceae bacterium]
MSADERNRPSRSRPPRGPGIARPPAKNQGDAGDADGIRRERWIETPGLPARSASARPPDADAVEAIVRAEHGDPFAFLGPHQVGPDLWVIRAMLPEARAASVERDGDRIAMEQQHEAGLFVARLTSASRPTYRLRIETGDGIVLREDPYRFESFLRNEDLGGLREVGGNTVYCRLGAHRKTLDGVAGFGFAVWAPNARRVSVVGDFNDWDGRRHPMRLRHEGGVWELFVPGLDAGARYKFEIKGADGGLHLKADPVALASERPPATASVLHGEPEFEWRNEAWMARRGAGDPRKAPISVYECHLGSWARVPGEGHRYLTYREMAERLVPYVKDLGFTHIELLPITEFPFDGSWGYQPVSLFAPTSRFGSPEDFCALVEAA